jgi:ATP/maltotriose-dependent transcriptional regulator MalT
MHTVTQELRAQLLALVSTHSAQGAAWIEPMRCAQAWSCGAVEIVGSCALPAPVFLGEPLPTALTHGASNQWSLARPLRAHYQRLATAQEEARDARGQPTSWRRALLYDQERCLGILLINTDEPMTQQPDLAPLMDALRARHTRRVALLEDAYIFCDARGQRIGQTQSAARWLRDYAEAELRDALDAPRAFALDAAWTRRPLDGEPAGSLIALTPPTLIRLDPFDALSERQREVLLLLASGASNQTIAESLNISTNTVKYHTKTLYKTLDVSSVTELLQLLDADHIAHLRSITAR